jgi:cytochrome c-type biogenesis protein
VDLLLQGFVLGNGAILTNVCLLPLYPGMIAFLAAQEDRGGRGAGWLGLFVLAGVLSLMLALGAVLMATRVAVAAWLPWLLPLTYGVVALLGVALLLGRNPFARLSTGRVPGLRDPRAAAFAYGVALAPMTLPCTGPVVVAAFVLGAGDPGALGAELAYVLAFGVGFGWPLALLPWLAQASQRRVTRWLTRHHRLTSRLAGLLLVGIATWGVVTEVAPNLA